MTAPISSRLLSFATGAALASLALTAPAQAEDSALKIFTETCLACHGESANAADRAAPPIFAAKNHYSDLTNKEDFVAALSAYIQSPSEEAARMPGAIKKFGLMPDLGLDAETADKLAEFVWQTDFSEPDWYRKHYEEEHGTAPSN
jgi:hypothetical protein